MTDREELCVIALDGIEDPIDFVASAHLMMNNMQAMKLNESVMKFIGEVAKFDKPRSMKLVVDISDQKSIPFVSFWACVGEGNPVDRVVEVAKELLETKRLLALAISKDYKLTTMDLHYIRTKISGYSNDDVYIGSYRKRYVIISNLLEELWAKEYFKTEEQARAFIIANKLKLTTEFINPWKPTKD
jgi:hypothetical protein